MRFLCPKCKAKYQIADEKLEGRSVRMKCRKCGHVIEVPSPSKKPGSGSVRPGAPEAGAAKPAAAKPPAPKPAAPKPPAPKPAAPKPAAPKPVAPKPAPPRPGAAVSPRPAPVRPSAPSVPSRPSQPEPSPAPPAPAAGGLASAFSQKVREPQHSDVSAAIEVLSAGAGEEWYVGINGVPLGPVRLSTLRQKAQQGVIDEESLVWREGFEEWLPLRTFPELLVLVRESREASGRVSFTPAPPPAHSISQSPRPAPVPAAPVAPAVAPSGPRPGAAAEIEQEPATVVASSPEALEAMAQAQVTKDPFAPEPAPAVPSNIGLPAAPPEPIAPEPDEGARHSVVDDIALGVRRQVRMHPAAYVLIAIAFGFGVTGAIVFFSSDPAPAPPPTIQVVTVAAPNTGEGTAAEAPAASVAMNTDDEEGSTPVKSGGGARVAGNGTESAAKGATDTDDKDKGSSPRKVGLGDGPSIEGPSVGGPGAGATNLPQQLDQSDIERVVASHRASVKRGCWEPALATRDRNAPKSAKVTVSISIGPSGNVSSASASGGSGYPGLASCVANKVRRWKFPPSGGTSQANIPFAFFSQ